MEIKNISGVDQVLTLRVGKPARRVPTSIAPDEKFEVSDAVGINICKVKGRSFAPATKKDEAILEKTYPKPTAARVKRQQNGTEKQAEKDIAKGKAAEEA